MSSIKYEVSELLDNYADLSTDEYLDALEDAQSEIQDRIDRARKELGED